MSGDVDNITGGRKDGNGETEGRIPKIYLDLTNGQLKRQTVNNVLCTTAIRD